MHGGRSEVSLKCISTKEARTQGTLLNAAPFKHVRQGQTHTFNLAVVIENVFSNRRVFIIIRNVITLYFSHAQIRTHLVLSKCQVTFQGRWIAEIPVLKSHTSISPSCHLKMFSGLAILSASGVHLTVTKAWNKCCKLPFETGEEVEKDHRKWAGG